MHHAYTLSPILGLVVQTANHSGSQSNGERQNRTGLDIRHKLTPVHDDRKYGHFGTKSRMLFTCSVWSERLNYSTFESIPSSRYAHTNQVTWENPVRNWTTGHGDMVTRSIGITPPGENLMYVYSYDECGFIDTIRINRSPRPIVTKRV